MTGPVDNLQKQRARAGVKSPRSSMSDDDFAAAMGAAPVKAPVREYDMVGGKLAPRAAPVQRADDFTTEELYALGSSPQTLRAQLSGPVERKEEPGFFSRMKANPVGETAGLVGGAFDRAADAASLGGYTWGRNKLYGAISPKLEASTRAVDDDFSRQHPNLANAADAVGYMSPLGVPNLFAKGAAVAGEAGAKFLAGKLLPKALERPVAGAVTGSIATGATAAGEAYMGNEDASGILGAGAKGAGYGAAFGGAMGIGQGVIGRQAERADKWESKQNIADFTDGAPAAKRDRVVGKSGEKRDRIDALARRTPDLREVRGDAVKQEPIVAREIDRVGASLDQVYEGGMARPNVIVDPMRQVAAEIRSKAHTGQEAEVAKQLETEADRVAETWSSFSKKGRGPNEYPAQPRSHTEPSVETIIAGRAPKGDTVRMSHEDMRSLGYADRIDRRGRIGQYEPPPEQGYIDAREARQMITKYGKGLYGGNPNNVPSIPKEIRQEVYRRQVDALRDTMEHFKPGVSEELNAYNAEMSDWLNIHDAVKSRAARAQTPGMTLKGQANGILDTALAVMHPTHYLAKKGLEHGGPGALRFINRELAQQGATGMALREANPLIQALESERAKSRRREELIRGAQEGSAEFETMRRQQEQEELARRVSEYMMERN